ncbi:MAG: hypothetical protein M0038_21070 [Pseudomonadota bacterium]|jgi:lipopolysaccharide export LptBFGC system permease protein LptF|nr:hypothetical protein [Pseudomonadota bacterium]
MENTEGAEEIRQENVAHYGATVKAWYDTRLERDKGLMTLSAGGIGLLLSLIHAFGIHSAEDLALYLMALMAFIICLFAILWIFRRNSDHLEGVVHRNETNDPLLGALDTIAVSAFILGVLLSFALGVASAARSFRAQEITMKKDDKPTSGSSSGGKEIYRRNDSLNGALNIAPKKRDVVIESFDGAGRMRPGSGQSKTAGNSGQSQTSSGTTARSPAGTPQKSELPKK